MKQPRILLVDDDVALCDLVRAALELEGLDVVEAHHAIEAEQLIHDQTPDAIVLDIGLPGIDGLFYCRRLRESPRTSRIPIIATSSSECTGAHATAAGATLFVRKPFDVLGLLTLLEAALGIAPLGRVLDPGESAEAAAAHADELRRLIDIGRHRHDLVDRAYRDTVAALAASIEIRGFETGEHANRVTAYAMRLTVEVAPSLTDDPTLEWGFLLHDLGNIGIPDGILLKRGSLKAEEWATLRGHTTIGEQLLATVPLLDGEGLKVVRSHHERWDGGGYPDGLTATDIPLGARIFAVADALDAMTDRRPYRRPLRWDAALGRLRKEAGGQFDPDVIDGLLACEPDLVSIRKRFLDSRQAQATTPLPAFGGLAGPHLSPLADSRS